MTWSSGRPIFNRLPVPYQNSSPANWFTEPWDKVLIDTKLQGDDFYTNYLNPSTALESVLDWLAQFCGFTGEYWDSSWPVSIKRTLIQESYQRIWPQKGSRELLEWLISTFSLQAAVYIPGEFLAGVSRAGDTLGSDTGLVYYIRLPLLYPRTSTEWLTVENINQLYGPVYAKSRVMYELFYAGVSVAGDLVFSEPLFDALIEVLSPPFTLPTGLEVSREGFIYQTNLDPTSFEFSTDVTYYVEKSGDNANDGSQTSPFLTVRYAIETLESSVNTSGTILVGDGIYTNDWINTRTSKDIVVKASGIGETIFRISSFQTWTLETGNVWKAKKDTTPPLTHCYDLARSQANVMPAFVGSIAEVAATPGTQYLAPDETLYVHLLDSRQPDGDVEPSFAIEAGGVGDDRSAIDGTNLQIYVEGCIFEGGNLGFTINGTGQDATVNSCIFRYSSGDGFSTLPPDETVSTTGILRLFNCTAQYNFGNGFDLQTDVAGLTVIHEGCSAVANGLNGKRLSNLTSIAVQSSYTGSTEDNTLIVAGASAWEVGITGLDAQAGSDFEVVSGSSVWFYGCNTIGSSATYGIEAASGATAVLQARNTIHSVLIQ